MDIGTNKSYDDSVKLKRTEMDHFRFQVRGWGLKQDWSQREPEVENIDKKKLS